MNLSAWLWGLIPDTVGFIAVYLLAKRKRSGWLVMLFNLLVIWTAFSIVHGIWGFFPGILAHAYMALRGWNNWTK